MCNAKSGIGSLNADVEVVVVHVKSLVSQLLQRPPYKECDQPKIQMRKVYVGEMILWAVDQRIGPEEGHSFGSTDDVGGIETLKVS